MIAFLRTVVLAVVIGVCARSAYSQEQVPEPSEEAQYEFVSGTIADLPPGKIVVNRAVIGKPAEMWTFIITPETKIEGKLKTRLRVTVGFKTSDGGEPIAMRIIVRPQNGKK
jgi:hypothetical protein